MFGPNDIFTVAHLARTDNSEIIHKWVNNVLNLQTNAIQGVRVFSLNGRDATYTPP